MSDEHQIAQAIIGAARTIMDETGRIQAKMAEVEKHVRARKDAVRMLAGLTDVTVDLMPASMSIVPYEDAMLLEIYKAGSTGATRYHLKTIWRMKFGREAAPAALDATLKSLVDQGKIVDRAGTWAVTAPWPTLARPEAPGSMKDRVIDILRGKDAGIKVQAISDELARLYGTDVPVVVISPLLSRLKRSGRVVHEGHRWRLADLAAEALERSED